MSVDIVTLSKGKKVSAQKIKSKAIRILKLLNKNQSELSLALVGNREIRRLNSHYRNKNEPTDVLSFPLEEDLPKGGATRLYSRGTVHRASSGGTLRSVSSFAKATEDALIHPRPHGRGYLRFAEEGKNLLGDVVISVEQAEKQAKEGMKSLEKELEILLIHGILHLLGYDHEVSPKEARRMHRMVKRIERALCDPKNLRL